RCSARRMKSIDIHAHLVPRSAWRAAEAGREWYGFRHEPGEGVGSFMGNDKRIPFTSPKVRFTPEERIADMDAQGVDVQVVSIHTPFFGYHLDPARGRELAREVNDEIASMTTQWPTRFAGLATLPVQDVKLAIDELERAVTVLGLKGAELDTLVNGENWDEPRFLPLFKAAEQLPASSLLRHRGREREGAAIPARRGGRRPRGARQRLALRAVASLAGRVGAGVEDGNAGGEEPDPLAEPRSTAEALALHLHPREPLEHLHDREAVFLVEPGRARHLVELLRDVRQQQRHTELLGERGLELLVLVGDVDRPAR